MRKEDTIELIRKRDERGMELLLRHYGALMRYIISPIIESEHDREECISEAAMRVWDGIDSYSEARGSFSAWLTAVTRNMAQNRARRRHPSESLEDISEEVISEEPTPEEAVLKAERAGALRYALRQLPPRDMMLFYRKYYYLQSTSQIASELGMTERAVEGKLYRIRKQLRNMLGGDGR